MNSVWFLFSLTASVELKYSQGQNVLAPGAGDRHDHALDKASREHEESFVQEREFRTELTEADERESTSKGASTVASTARLQGAAGRIKRVQQELSSIVRNTQVD